MRGDLADARTLIGQFLLPYWRRTLLLVLLSTAAALIAVAQPMLLAPVMDLGTARVPRAAGSFGEINLNNVGATLTALVSPHGTSLRAIDVAFVSLVMFALVGLVSATLQFATQMLSASITLAGQRDLQTVLYQRLLMQDLSFFAANRSGDLANRFVLDAGESMAALDLTIRQALQSALQITLFGFLLVQTSPILALATLMVSMAHLAVNRVIGGRLRQRTATRVDDMGRLASFLNETFAAVRVIRTAAIEKVMGGRFAVLAEQSRAVALAYTVTKNAETPLRGVTDTVALAVVFAIALGEFAAGTMTFQGLVLFMVVVRLTIAPISLFAQAFTRLQGGLGSAQSILELLAAEPGIRDGARDPEGFGYLLAIESVSFAYPGGDTVLRGIDLQIRKGETVAVVGRSGGGKSTLLDLVLRLQDPTAGRVTLDGIDIREFKLDGYRRLFGVVSQDPVLFNDTLEANIVFGRRDGGPDRLYRALSIANANEFVERLPGGVETKIGDRGVRLSGGQRQRIAIARAIYAEPAILVLDEATSSLDSDSERLVQDAIAQVLRHATAIIVAHRLSTIRDASRIVVLNGGAIEAVGSHDKLLVTSATYRLLYDTQFSEVTTNAPPQDDPV